MTHRIVSYVVTVVLALTNTAVFAQETAQPRPAQPDRAQRPSIARIPSQLRVPRNERRTDLELQGQVAELERQISIMKAEHNALIEDLKALLATAEQEKARKTVQQVNDLIAKRQKAHDKDLDALESRLQRLKTIQSDLGKRRASENRIGTVAPSFDLAAYNGRKASLADAKGKVVVLEWMNPDCKFTQFYYAKKVMQNLAAQYADKGVAWLSIDSNPKSTAEQVQAFADKYRSKTPVLNDATGQVARLYHVNTTPHCIVIDTEGRIVYSGGVYDGLDKVNAKAGTNYVDQALSELLAGKPVSTPLTPAPGTPLGLPGQ